MSIEKTVREHFKEISEEKNISVKMISEYTGWSERKVSGMLKSEDKRITLREIKIMCEALGVDVRTLLTDERYSE